MGKLELPTSVFNKCDVIDFTSQADQQPVLNILFLKNLNKIACFHQNGLVTLYEADTHYPVRTFKAHYGSITAACFNQKKKTLITQYIGEIKVWDLSNVRFNQVSVLNIDISIATSLDLLKKKNHLIVSGEHKCVHKPGFYDTLFLISVDGKEVLSKWQDRSVVTSTQKIRYGKGKHLLACGFANGLLKMFSCENKLNCLRVVKAHHGRISKLHVTRINNHPYCISESDDKKIRLWNVSSNLLKLRTFTFPTKTIIGGTYYNHKVLILMQEAGTQVIFVNLLRGNVFKRVDVGISTIKRGLTFGRSPKMVVVLDIAKLVYLGIKN